MLNIVKEEGKFYLIIGFNPILKVPRHKLELSHEEIVEVASNFNTTFAEGIGIEENPTWEFGKLKITNAPLHPYGYTDSRERVIFHYKDLHWHMIVPEIQLLGDYAKKVLSEN